jgi:hypothetical protein
MSCTLKAPEEMRILVWRSCVMRETSSRGALSDPYIYMYIHYININM